MMGWVDGIMRPWRKTDSRRKGPEPPVKATETKAPANVPEDLAAAIAAASVIERDTPDDETGHARVAVDILGLGNFYLVSREDTVKRILRHRPNLDRRAAQRAAVLIERTVAEKTRTNRRAAVSFAPRRASSWVFDLDR